MLIAFANGAFALFSPTTRAWYSPQGDLVDAEHKLPRHRCRPVQKGGPTWRRLATDGTRYLSGRLAQELAGKVAESKKRLLAPAAEA